MARVYFSGNCFERPLIQQVSYEMVRDLAYEIASILPENTAILVDIVETYTVMDEQPLMVLRPLENADYDYVLQFFRP